MKARIKWVEEVSFLGETESGHAVLMDGPPTGGGRNLGPRPMEMLLIGTGACTAYDVVTILKKSRQKITDCVVDIQSDRADTDPKVFTKYPPAFRGDRQGPQARTSRTRHQPVSREILLGFDHDGQDSEGDARFRDRGGVAQLVPSPACGRGLGRGKKNLADFAKEPLISPRSW